MRGAENQKVTLLRLIVVESANIYFATTQSYMVISFLFVKGV